MNNYLEILREISINGYDMPPAREQDVSTRQLDTYLFKHDLREGFPLLTTKKMFSKGIIAELLWFMRGETNIKPLLDVGVSIWTEWPYAEYKKYAESKGKVAVSMKEFEALVIEEPFFAKQWGDCGPIYGAQWRKWRHSIDNGIGMVPTTVVTDQLDNLIKDIKKVIETGKHNRRLIVNAWNVGEIPDMKLPPCHKDFQVILEPISLGDRIKIAGLPQVMSNARALGELKDLGVPKHYLNLVWNQRSVDTFLGLPFNIASYALLATILAQVTNTIPKMLYGELRNVHIYANHKEQVEEQLSRTPKKLPKLVFDDRFMERVELYRSGVNDLNDFLRGMDTSFFKIEGYEHHAAIKGEVSL